MIEPLTIVDPRAIIDLCATSDFRGIFVEKHTLNFNDITYWYVEMVWIYRKWLFMYRFISNLRCTCSLSYKYNIYIYFFFLFWSFRITNSEANRTFFCFFFNSWSETHGTSIISQVYRIHDRMQSYHMFVHDVLILTEVYIFFFTFLRMHMVFIYAL